MEPTEALEAASQAVALTAWVEATTATASDTWLASTDAEPFFAIILMAAVFFLICLVMDLLVCLAKVVLLAALLTTFLHTYSRRQEGPPTFEQ